MIVVKSFGDEQVRAHVSYNASLGLYFAMLLGDEFNGSLNVHACDDTIDGAMVKLRLRVLKLRGSFFNRGAA